MTKTNMTKHKQTLQEDMSSGLINKVQYTINQYTGQSSRFYYYHDSYKKDGCIVHMHKFKRKGILSHNELQELCQHLDQQGFYGFKPTSTKTEQYSGIVRYHKVKSKNTLLFP